MIIKILSSSSPDFHGVKYNDKKVEKGTGELMLMKNFPSFINETSNQEEVRNYFKSISKNEKVKKPQFHAVISTKFQQHSKEELTKVAENFMEEMNYGTQPFIVVFHNDTDNNHVHIVSTRVDKETGKKLNDSFERLKAQQSLSNVLEKLYGIKSGE
ncbi:relaxase/mobilization nuclease domain-containing protein, partial [Kaistella sp.]|uniref:relaxase/mobilization nuclease domain-containing protein n=1 Tax=Kaistella sp. TaxID=2782235 RepID=UPI003C61F236